MFTIVFPHESINSNCVFTSFWKYTVEVIEGPIQTDLKTIITAESVGD